MVIFHLLTVCWFPILWYVSWVYGAGSIIADPNAYREDIETPYLIPCEGRFFEIKEKVLRCIGQKGYQDRYSWNSQLAYRERFAKHLNSSYRSTGDQDWIRYGVSMFDWAVHPLD